MSDLGVLKDIARRVAVSIIDFEEFSVETECVDVEKPVHNWFYHSDDDCDRVQPGVYFRLNDNQCANLGGIEDEYFSSLSDVIGRMEIYHEDYFFSDLSERYDDGDVSAENEHDSDNLWSVLCAKLLKSRIFYDLLDDSPCDEYINSYDLSYEEMVTLKDFLYEKEPELVEIREF